jgi:hypothetical protein
MLALFSQKETLPTNCVCQVRQILNATPACSNEINPLIGNVPDLVARRHLIPGRDQRAAKQSRGEQPHGESNQARER